MFSERPRGIKRIGEWLKPKEVTYHDLQQFAEKMAHNAYRSPNRPEAKPVISLTGVTIGRHFEIIGNSPTLYAKPYRFTYEEAAPSGFIGQIPHAATETVSQTQIAEKQLDQVWKRFQTTGQVSDLLIEGGQGVSNWLHALGVDARTNAKARNERAFALNANALSTYLARITELRAMLSQLRPDCEISTHLAIPFASGVEEADVRKFLAEHQDVESWQAPRNWPWRRIPQRSYRNKKR